MDSDSGFELDLAVDDEFYSSDNNSCVSNDSESEYQDESDRESIDIDPDYLSDCTVSDRHGISRRKITTLSRLTKYEKTQLFCIRSQQLTDDCASVLSLADLEKCSSIIDIVKLEFQLGKLPLVIHRITPNGSIEIIKK